jgi:hypothetical protein|tara:strand:- start:99 stop:287 length:189 start_codon:yes stop_codon:yes gene_type:complete
MNNLNNVLDLALKSDKKTFEFSKMNAEATLKTLNKINNILDIINKELLSLKNRVTALEKTIT